MQKNFYISTAISYPNGPPHIGHAYEVMATDAIARFRRLSGDRVLFSTGTDDHGQKMFQTARDQGKTARALADELTPAFEEMARRLSCSHDDFIRTSEPRHYAAVQAIWTAVAANGDIYKDSYAGWYSVRDEAFYTESEVETDADGAKISPQGTPVEWLEEESYFFRLSDYQDRLLELYKNNPQFIQPDSRRNEIIKFVEGGLKDLSVSRTAFDWGRAGARRSGACDLCLDGCADQLSDRDRISRNRQRLTTPSGRRVCILSVRTLPAFTRFTGRPS